MPYAARRSIRRRRTSRRYIPKSSSRKMVRSYRGRKASIPRNPFRSKWKNPLSTGAMFKFKYADSDFNMSTTVGSAYQSSNIFSGNSIFDPDATGVGVQPYGYDPLSALYGHFHVYASKIKVRFYTAEAPVYKATCTVVPAIDEPLDYSDPNDLRIMTKAKQHIISSTEGITRGHFIQSYCSTAALYRGQTIKDDDFGAAWTANPLRRWYWHIYVDTTDTATEDTISMDVQITYYAIVRKTTNNNES